MSNSNWICDNGCGLCNKTREDRNRYKIECPSCGAYWFVDKDDECLNDGSDWNPYEDEEDTDSECISIDEAAQIWLSHGKDEDYTCGYDEEDLEEYLDNRY